MGCIPFLGGIVCVRGRGTRPNRCYVCKKPSDVLCDWFTGPPKLDKEDRPRCSRPCCREHSRHVGQDKDLCQEHAIQWDHMKAQKQGGTP